MATTEKQIAANRINALKSHGPKNTASTRFNATKHGLLAAGITELDDGEDYQTTLRDLVKETNAVGRIETFLVESIAVDMVRSRPARRLEGEYITDVLNPPIYKRVTPSAWQGPPVLDPGLPAAMKLESVQPLVNVYQRYEATISQRLFRNVRELKQWQRMRHGELPPAPVAVDVIVHQETERESGTALLPQKETSGDNGDTVIERVTLPEPETEILGDREVKD